MNAILVFFALAYSDDGVSCGASCVFLFARDLGVATDLSSIRQLLPDVSNGHAFTDLQAAAKSLGVRSVIRNLKESGEMLPRKPFIAHLQATGEETVGHFVYVRPMEPTGMQYQLIAPPGEPEVVFARDFVARPEFTGWVMNLSSRRRMTLGGCLFTGGCILLFAHLLRQIGERTRFVP